MELTQTWWLDYEHIKKFGIYTIEYYLTIKQNVFKSFAEKKGTEWHCVKLHKVETERQKLYVLSCVALGDVNWQNLKSPGKSILKRGVI